jgi:hypothetical protein
VKDEPVSVKIVATNFYGDSPDSVVGSGAFIQLVPDAPVDLQNDPTQTDAFSIRFTWVDGLSDGGSPVIDYDIYYD